MAPTISSHPMWVRGLKLLGMPVYYTQEVAPYVGAWIETSSKRGESKPYKSHPMWVRGLKHRYCCKRK